MSALGAGRSFVFVCIGVGLGLGAALAGCSDRRADDRVRRDDAGTTEADADAGARAARPPRIDAARLLLVIEDADQPEGGRVHLVGERGAVTPGGIEVEVEWPVTKERSDGDVAADGSFDVEVSGWLQERYRVQAVRRSPPARSESVFVWRTGDGMQTAVSVDGTEPPVSSTPGHCMMLGEELSRRLGSFDIGGRCTQDSDCAVVRDEGCGGVCYTAALPRGAEAVAQAGFSAVRASLCSEYTAAGCLLDQGPFTQSCAQTSVEPRCIDGVCVSCSSETCHGVDLCESCPWPDIAWGPIGEASSAHQLRECRAYSTILEDGALCTSKLSCAGNGRTNWYNASTLLAQLDYPDVRAALERNAYFGGRSANVVGVQLTVGSGSITVSTARCNGAAGCEEPPEEVTRLRDLLNGIVFQEDARCR